MSGDSAGRVFCVNRPRAEFYRWWMELTTPFHHLRASERRLAAAMLDKRAELASLGVDRPDAMLLSGPVKAELRDALDMSPAMLNTQLCRLRKAGFIKDGVVNPLLAPDIGEDGFTAEIRFKFNGDGRKDGKAGR